jgi:ParB family chromosome partitioning protein
MFKVLRTVYIPLAEVDPHPNFRRELDTSRITELADSMKAFGQRDPITVIEKDNKFYVLSGNRRVQTANSLGLEEIKADIVEADDLHAELWFLDANLTRADFVGASERVTFTARRIELWKTLDPEGVSPLSGNLA